ncbi:hypothetical protein COB11_08495 [Candidatus Aerophobetes bacterium]|uniref:Glycosyl transferase family 1 domain-containing protein n=1 Tax=Aerophobetes bacterium TaxID=2030807 RepID=A0A2A4YAF7_UNCAE|nr:MAG: hypothetical protein COB11_08495 [Candidatus Aerophobetes bacterium]
MRKRLLFLCIFLTLSLVCYKFYQHHYKNTKRPDVSVAGFVDMADGLGRHSVEIIETLKKKFDVHFQNTRDTFYKDVPKNLHKTLKRRNRPQGKVVIYEDTIMEPEASLIKTFSKTYEKQVRIAYTMFESSRLSPVFVERLHKYFDAVVVPDPYNVKVYKDSGVTLPIFVIPLGLNLDPFFDAKLKEKPNSPFVFANFSSCENRKNSPLLVQAFANAFGNRKDVTLLINARRGFDTEISAVKKVIEDEKLTNVTFNINKVSKDVYVENFKSIDCYVSLSKGEGFSIQPREAMALGVPCIVSDNTAQSTICNSHLVKSVASEIIDSPVYELFVESDFGSNFNVDLVEATNALLDVYQNYEKYLSLSKMAREWCSKYRYENLERLYFTLVKPKHLVFGTEDSITENKITTTSKELIEKYKSIYPKLKITCEHTTY